MAAFIKALLFVVVGEMGDKTQLLAMAMAGKYRARDVMLGVFFATVLNHALAVAAGSLLGSLIPMSTVSMVAAVSFLIFGLWTIRGDADGDERRKNSRFGPILTVGIAFFLAEMGDKTQLMTIAIAAEFRQPVLVLLGTTSGMLIADGLGVLCGAWICRQLGQSTVKWIAGLVFMAFGSFTLYETLPGWMIQPVYIGAYLVLLGGLTYLIGVRLANRPHSPCEET
jgi:Ca2+/H+ antiporter, TMEM165/GDT1 family